MSESEGQGESAAPVGEQLVDGGREDVLRENGGLLNIIAGLLAAAQMRRGREWWDGG